MIDDEINQAIAETLGRKHHKPTDSEVKSGSYYQYEPRYTEDLNAINKVIRSKWNVLSGWAMEMRRIVCRDDPDKAIDDEHLSDLWFYCATARQRAEAYLRTIGKWKE